MVHLGKYSFEWLQFLFISYRNNITGKITKELMFICVCVGTIILFCVNIEINNKLSILFRLNEPVFG